MRVYPTNSTNHKAQESNSFSTFSNIISRVYLNRSHWQSRFLVLFTTERSELHQDSCLPLAGSSPSDLWEEITARLTKASRSEDVKGAGVSCNLRHIWSRRLSRGKLLAGKWFPTRRWPAASWWPPRTAAPITPGLAAAEIPAGVTINHRPAKAPLFMTKHFILDRSRSSELCLHTG